MPTIRIFISSPGDVIEERDLARKVVEQLRRRYAGRLELKAVLWEDLPLGADMSFQQGIDLVLSDAGVDIALFILWSRLGSPTGALVTKADGTEYRSGTEREFDLMLAARRQSGGKRPHILVYTRADESSFEERLRGQSTEAKTQLLDQKRLVEGYIREEFHDPERRTNVRAYHSFDRPQTFSQRVRVHLAELLDGVAGEGGGDPLWDVVEKGPPFLGLAAYQFDHAAIFFGREDEIVGIRQALRAQACRGCAFVLISGASGSGKSSLARAGVLPAIVENEIDEAVAGWRHAAFTPGEIAGDLYAGLARVLADALPTLGGGPDALAELAEGLATNPDLTFKLRIKGALAPADGRKGALRLILLVDQLEELFTDARIDVAKREQFAAVLETLARSGAVWVLATVRSDFAHHCQGVPALVRLREGAGHWDLLPPTSDALGRVIQEPARLARLCFEERDGQSLADRILRDAIEHRELLPLLSHLLHDLCGERTGEGMMTFAAYEKAGGVQGALARHAEATFQGLPTESQAALPALLTELVTLGGDDGASFVRRRPSLATLLQDPAMRLLVGRFIAARLLTAAGAAGSPEATVTLAHEAVLRVWERACSWAVENREHLRLRARIEPAQERWEKQGQHPSLLLAPGLPLEEGRGLLAEAPALLGPATRKYIQTSITQAEADEARRRRIRHGVVTALSLLLVAALVAAFLAVKSQREGEKLLWQASKSDSEESMRKLAVEGDWNTAVAYGARALRIRQGNADAARRLFGHTLLAGVAQSRILAHDGPVTHARILPDGNSLITVSGGTVRRWESADGKPWISRVIFTAAKGESIAALSPSADRFCVLAPDGSARTVDAATGAAGPSMAGEKPARAIFSPDGGRLITLSGEGTVALWDTRSGKKAGSLTSRGDTVTTAAIASDGSRILTGTKVGTIRCWKSGADGEAWESEWTLEDPLPSGVAEITISPDGSRFAAVSDDGTAGCWSMPTRFQVASLKGEQPAARIAYSADGSLVATGGNGGTVQLWERATGKPLAFLRGHRAAITALDFSEDGRFLLSACEDGTVRLWEMARCPLDAPGALKTADAAEIPPAPGWVYESLLPFLCGKELDREGRILELPVSRQLEAQAVVEQRIEAVRADRGTPAGPWDRFLAWKFLADPRTRAIRPGSPVTVPQFVERSTWKDKQLADESGRRTAWLAAPGHPLAQWALGETHAGGAWGGWLQKQALTSLEDPVAGALYGADEVARWKHSQAAFDSAERTRYAVVTNSLGMKFVPVAVAGGKTVLFSVWETRVQDYAAYADAEKEVNATWKDVVWKGQKLTPTPDSPVVGVNWEDAQKFCQWLTARERAAGKITATQRYRLPTDEEWSWAVGIGAEEEEALRGRSPKDKSEKVPGYPWGTFKYPPQDSNGKPLGNYADSERKKAFPETLSIDGYTDGYATTSPAGSFPPGAHGLYDMGGNVWEWCEDWYDPAEKKSRVVRGASWSSIGTTALLSSCRRYDQPDVRLNGFGFRCVLAEASSAP